MAEQFDKWRSSLAHTGLVYRGVIMPLYAAFRRSFYATLGSACLALGYAEYALLPETSGVASVVLGALVGLYYKESRWAVLSIPAANRLGAVVGLLTLLWAAWRMGREWFHPQLLNTDWSLLLVALLGPLTMVLLPAKLLRRDKHIGDYWWLHGLALATATLAAAMIEDVVGFVLLLIYVFCAVWNLRLLHVVRSAGWLPPLPGQPYLRIRHIPSAPKTGWGRGYGITHGILPVAAALLFAIPLFLLTPRSPLPPASFGKPRIEIGFAADQMLDLTRTGHLHTNRTPLFEVTVQRLDGTPGQLSPEQRWRGRELRLYNAGRWEAGDSRLPTILPATHTPTPWRPPHLGPEQLLLTFHLRPPNHSFFLADPVAWRAHQPVPIISLPKSGPPIPWHWLGDGTFYADWEGSEQFPYQQHWHPAELPDLSPPFIIIEPNPGPLLRALTQNPLPRLQEYADNLVRRWIQTGRLPADLMDPVVQRPRRQYHGQLARLLCEHLRSEAGLQYTTTLRLSRSDLDPLEDFLFYSKAGHCERFASALVLLLRSQGIPAQLILGCKGCEPLDQPGRYLVRHEHAHAWVECLLEEFQPPLQPGLRPVSRWLSLDPTPSEDSSVISSDSHWAQRTHQELQQWFRNYLIEFTPEQQKQTWRLLGAYLRWLLPLIGSTAGALVVLSILYRWWQRRIKQTLLAPRHPCSELFSGLKPLGIPRLAGETMAGWAERIAARMHQDPQLAPYAELPLQWVHTYYAERFGGQTFSTEHWARLRQRLQELIPLLRQRSSITVEPPTS
jgi:hypothetical protein